MRGVMGEAAGCPELTVADAIDTSFDLPLHLLGNRGCHLRGDDRRVRYFGAGKPTRRVLRDLVADWKKWSRAERILAVMGTLLMAALPLGLLMTG